jgi:hypothetical protein
MVAEVGSPLPRTTPAESKTTSCGKRDTYHVCAPFHSMSATAVNGAPRTDEHSLMLARLSPHTTIRSSGACLNRKGMQELEREFALTKLVVNEPRAT